MQSKQLGLCESGAKDTTFSSTSSRDSHENMLGHHGAAPYGSDHSMASGLSSFEEEKVMKCDREVSEA